MSAHKQSLTYQTASKEGRRRLDVVAALPPLKRYLYWIQERESIRLARKDKIAKPWTVDPILLNFRFCNARRMDDRVSKWLYNHWYKPNYNHPNMLLAVVLARHFNQPDTLSYIGFPSEWDPDEFYQLLLNYKEANPGKSVFNGAYMIRSSSNSSPHFYPDKSEMVIRETVQQFVDTPPSLDTDCMEESVMIIQCYRNFGPFMAGQVVADLRHAIDGNWKDRNTWAAIGPGSHRGMNRLHERPLKQRLKPEKFVVELRNVMKQARESLPKSITTRLEAIDYQNCFCEWDKYERTIQGESRPKQKYPGAA